MLIVVLALAPYPARALAVARANADARNPSILEPGLGVDGSTFWTERFQFLVDGGRLEGAAEIFERLGVRAPVPMLTIAPGLLTLLGPEHEAAARAAWSRSAAIEWTLDETRLQAIAWRRQPEALRSDRIQLGSFDLGLISGFGPPLPRTDSPDLSEADRALIREAPTYRWTRGRSRLRLCVQAPGPSTLTLRMAAPLPAPRIPMLTSVLFDGRLVGAVEVGRETKDYEFRVVAAACPGVIEIRSGVWTASDQPAELGVQVLFAGLKTR